MCRLVAHWPLPFLPKPRKLFIGWIHSSAQPDRLRTSKASTLLSELAGISTEVGLRERIKLSTAIACFAAPLDDGLDLVQCIREKNTDYDQQYLAIYLAGKHFEEIKQHGELVLSMIEEIVQRRSGDKKMKERGSQRASCCIIA